MDEKNYYGKKLEEFINNNVPKSAEIQLETLTRKANKSDYYIKILDEKHIIISNAGEVKNECVMLFGAYNDRKINISYDDKNIIIDENSIQIIYLPFVKHGFTIEPDNKYPNIKIRLLGDFDVYKNLPEKLISLPCLITDKFNISYEKRMLCFLSEAQEYLKEYYRNASLEISKLIFQQASNKI